MCGTTKLLSQSGAFREQSHSAHHPRLTLAGDNIMECGHKTCPLLEITLIPLSQGKYAIVDTEDYDGLNKRKWCFQKGTTTCYAVRNGKIGDKHVTLRMHRLILDIPKGMDTDHRNHNGLDNRKCNLRLCSRAENQCNRLPTRGCASRFKGVSQNGAGWQARIHKNNKRIQLGTYKSEIDAAKAYNDKAKELFGEFARLNDIRIGDISWAE